MGRTADQTFVAEVGIRHGCPLSPLIFAVVADILLRVLKSRHGDLSFTRAFADDTAMLVQDTAHLEEIFVTFYEYAGFSNLHLNLKKTVIIPLFLPGDLQRARERILLHLPEASGMEINDHAKYLGALVGPGAAGRYWDAVILKVMKVVENGQGSTLGCTGELRCTTCLPFQSFSSIFSFTGCQTSSWRPKARP